MQKSFFRSFFLRIQTCEDHFPLFESPFLLFIFMSNLFSFGEQKLKLVENRHVYEDEVGNASRTNRPPSQNQPICTIKKCINLLYAKKNYTMSSNSEPSSDQ